VATQVSAAVFWALIVLGVLLALSALVSLAMPGAVLTFPEAR
jgi:hypothetical protein